MAALLGLCLVTSTSLAQPADWLAKRFPEGRLKYGGDAEGGAPYLLRDPKDPGKIIGFEVEIADALAAAMAKRLGGELRAEFVQNEWDSLPAALGRSDFDIAINGLEVGDDPPGLKFTRPYYVYLLQLVTRVDETTIRGPNDCVRRPVGTLGGSAAERWLEAAGATDVTSFTGQVEPYFDLQVGRLDAVLLDLPIATYYAGPNPKLKFVGEPVGQGYYGILVREDDREFFAAINEAIGELIRDGTLRRIYRKWHLWDTGQAALAQGERRGEELAGLGLGAGGEELAPDEPPPPDAVERNIIAASAKSWTLAQYGALLLEAAGMTVFLSIMSMALAMTLGLVVAVARLYGPAPVRWLALAYVEFFRGIPLLLLLFFLYYGMPFVGDSIAGTLNTLTGRTDPEAWQFNAAVITAILGFGINYAAYEAEIYRSSIQSVPLGQWEAGRALGMGDALTFRRIIFPQAFRTALGPMTNDFVAMFKDTSLVSVVGVRELTKEYQILSRSSFEFVKIGLLTLVLYLIMSVPLGYLSRWLEKRWSPGK